VKIVIELWLSEIYHVIPVKRDEWSGDEECGAQDNDLPKKFLTSKEYLTSKEGINLRTRCWDWPQRT
jgi:hypothetical protein